MLDAAICELFSIGAGNRLSVTATFPSAPSAYLGTTTYAYDQRNKLTQERSTRNGGYNNVNNYDGVTNGTTSGPGNPTLMRGIGQTFNADNQLTSSGMNSGFGYDGNPTEYKGKALTFDPENRMTAFGSAEINGYTTQDMRAWKQTPNGKTWFYYDAWGLPVFETNAASAVTAVDDFGVNGLLSRTSAGDTRYYLFDPEGNAANVLDGNGSVSTGGIFDAFGSMLLPNTKDPFENFGGQWGYYYDSETGLELLGHRFYDQSSGRFMTRDPFGYDGGINLYGYVRNSPTDHTDPFGLSPKAPYGGTNSKFPGDYGVHCGPNVYGPIAGKEDCIDGACWQHDQCLNKPICYSKTLTWDGFWDRKKCDLQLCGAAVMCNAFGCGTQACHVEAELITLWFCGFYPIGSGPHGPGGPNNGTVLRGGW